RHDRYLRCGTPPAAGGHRPEGGRRLCGAATACQSPMMKVGTLTEFMKHGGMSRCGGRSTRWGGVMGVAEGASMRRRRTIVATGVLLAAVAAALGFFWPFGGRAQTLRLPGIVEIQEVRLGSKVGGRVEEVLVLEGAEVKPGQPLVTFEVPELLQQR